VETPATDKKKDSHSPAIETQLREGCNERVLIRGAKTASFVTKKKERKRREVEGRKNE